MSRRGSSLFAMRKEKLLYALCHLFYELLSFALAYLFGVLLIKENRNG